MECFAKIKVKAGLIAASVLVMSSFAQAANTGPTRFSFLGGANYSMPAVGTVQGTGRLDYAFGAMAAFNTSSRFGIEIGGIYSERNFSAGNLTIVATGLSLPVMMKVTVGNVFILEGGGYFNVQVGNPTANGNVTTTSGAGLALMDYGAVGGVGMELAHFRLTGLYYYGVSNASTAGAAINHRDIQILAGFYF